MSLEILVFIGLVGMLIIAVSAMWWNEAVVRYDVLLEECKEALKKERSKNDELRSTLYEVRHVVVNDPEANYRTKAKVYALVKELE